MKYLLALGLLGTAAPAIAHHAADAHPLLAAEHSLIWLAPVALALALIAVGLRRTGLFKGAS